MNKILLSPEPEKKKNLEEGKYGHDVAKTS